MGKVRGVSSGRGKALKSDNYRLKILENTSLHYRFELFLARKTHMKKKNHKDSSLSFLTTAVVCLKIWRGFVRCFVLSLCVGCLLVLLSPLPAYAGALVSLVQKTQYETLSSQKRNDVIYALKQAEKGQWDALNRVEKSLPAGAVKSLLSWVAIERGGGVQNSFSARTNFIKSHPEWPFQRSLRLQAEKVITDNIAGLSLIQWFDEYPPLTGSAMEYYAKALKGRGQHKDLGRVLNDWWVQANLTRDQQKKFFASYGDLLSTSSHKKRLDNLLVTQGYDNAMAIARLLDDNRAERYQKLVRAHQALMQDLGNVDALVQAVPADLKRNEHLAFARLQWRRKQNLNDGAIALLKQAPESKNISQPKAWWRERHILIRRMIEEKKYQQAYRLAADHRQVEGFPMAQAEWVAGWLALRFVNKPWQAFEHFEKLYKNVNSPISRARGAYWAGRASERLGHGDVSRQWYSVAAQYNQTYYGQLAVDKLARAHQIYPSSDHPVSLQKQQRFAQNGLVQAAYLLSRAGMTREVDAFLLRILAIGKTQEDIKLLADYAHELKRPAIVIKAAGQAINDFGLNLVPYLYPVIPSSYKGARYVENALVHGLIRQESRFDDGVVSPAGARGLMQLMPATAKEVAGKKGVSHRTAWLTERPEHNVLLGGAYMQSLLERFGGHYPLAIAAYNAGPNRVARWLGEFGDPRQGDVDLIDWVETIPIYETRNYVQRVLEATYVYRHVLKESGKGNSKSPLHLAAK